MGGLGMGIADAAITPGGRNEAKGVEFSTKSRG